MADVSAKVAEYLEAGTRLVWVVELRHKTVAAYRADRSARLLIEGDKLDGGDVLPGFKLPLSEIFRQRLRLLIQPPEQQSASRHPPLPDPPEN